MNKLNKQLIVGPWVGEFGWELFAWQAYARSLSRKYQKTLVICRKNSEYLYSDFAENFIFCEPPGGPSDSFYRVGVDTSSLFKKIAVENKDLVQNSVLFMPRRIGYPPKTHYTESFKFSNHTIVPEYKVYGTKQQKEYDYIFHIRNRELRKEDNWSISSWKKLKNLLGDDKKVACIGTKESSGCLDDTEDLRDYSLKEVCTIIRSSSFVFGPSSGPMHLASLCNTPHIVWSKPENTDRYKNTWNPLGTKVLFMGDHSWHPTADYVYEKFCEWKVD